MKSQAASQLSSADPVRVLVNGNAPDALDLRHLALINYGHFTSMQVRDGKVRGLELHLTRIADSNREIFGHDLDIVRALDLMRLAVSDMPNCYLRTVFYEPTPDSSVVMTVQRPPVEANVEPVALLPVDYERPLAHLKHLGTFCKIHHAVLAERAGYDDALHTSPQGMVAETTGANIGFYREGCVYWPTEPALPGVTWHLLERSLAESGINTNRTPIHINEIPSFSAAFLTNSMGIAPIGRIGEVEFPDPLRIVEFLTPIYEKSSWDKI